MFHGPDIYMIHIAPLRAYLLSYVWRTSLLSPPQSRCSCAADRSRSRSRRAPAAARRCVYGCREQPPPRRVPSLRSLRDPTKGQYIHEWCWGWLACIGLVGTFSVCVVSL